MSPGQRRSQLWRDRTRTEANAASPSDQRLGLVEADEGRKGMSDLRRPVGCLHAEQGLAEGSNEE